MQPACKSQCLNKQIPTHTASPRQSNLHVLTLTVAYIAEIRNELEEFSG